jgi:glycosyltransferase involved in cell wall biosynthesis
VTLLTARSRGVPSHEVVEGVHVHRRGGRFSVYACALLWLLRHRRDVDAVVDFQNGIPFFTPLVTRRDTPVVCVVFHVHQSQFDRYFPWPVSALGRWLEGPASRLVYGQRSIVVISPSTRTEVRRLLRLRGTIHLVACGIDMPDPDRLSTVARSPSPRIAYVGRLAPHKQLHLLIDALPHLLAEHPELTVDLGGTGPSLQALADRADRLGVAHAVRFHGRVSDEERDRLLAGSWLTVNPSAGEGWGLSVIEANACGVPAVAFRVPGLQDAVVDGSTGWLVEPETPLAPAISEALASLSHPDAAEVWSRRVRDWAGRFTWEGTTHRVRAVLEHERERLGRTSSMHADQRRDTDLACRIDLPGDAATLTAVASSSRRTDVWAMHDERIVGLLPGTDEHGVRLAMTRMGLEGRGDIRTARPSDWLVGGTTAASPPVETWS